MNVIPLPQSMDERYFEAVVRDFSQATAHRLLFDATHVRWADPYGMVGLLALGHVARERGELPILKLPESPDVLSYMGRMKFFEHADGIFELNGTRVRGRDGGSDVLLEITAINSHADVHTVVDLVNRRGTDILRSQLHYPLTESIQFSVVLSEVCQNIIEHAEAGGWVLARDLDQVSLGELYEATGLRVPSTEARLPCRDDPLGKLAAEALDALRLPLRDALRRPVGPLIDPDRDPRP